MAKSFTARIRLIATDKASAVIGRVRTKMASLAGTLKKNLVTFAGATLAFAALAGGIRKVISASNEQIRVMAQLRNATKSFGKDSSAVSIRLAEYASSLQKLSTFGDEAIIGQISFLASLGLTEKQIKKATLAAIELASTGITTLESATRNIGKTFGGLAGELGELIPAMRGLTIEELKAGAALDVILNQFGGAAAANIGTFGGKVDQLAGTFGDLFERMGDVATKSGTVNKVLAGMILHMNNLNAVMADPKLTDHEKILLKISEAQKKLAKDTAEVTRLQNLQGKVPLGSAGNLRLIADAEIELARSKHQLKKAQEEEIKLLKSADDAKKGGIALDKEAIKAAEKLGIITRDSVNTALDAKRKSLEVLRKNADALNLSERDLIELELDLREEQDKLNLAFENSGGSLERYNAAIAGTKAALDPMITGLNTATTSTEKFNTQSLNALGGQKNLAVELDKSTRAYERLEAAARRAARAQASGPKNFGSPSGTNVDGTPREF